MLVAVSPTKFAFAVAGPEDDWRSPPGSPANCRDLGKGRRGVPCEGVLTHLENALRTPYATDAHWFPYIMRDPSGSPVRVQPRVRKNGDGLPYVESLGYRLEMSVLCADIDNPGHCDWTDELLELALADEARLVTAGVYHTAHGRRIVQPLTRPVPISEAEGVIAGWLRYLEELGLHPDWSCKDWTRCYRVPHATPERGRAPLDLRINVANMVAIDPPAPATAKSPSGRRRAVRSSTALGDIDGAPLAKAFDLAGWLGPKLGRDKRAAHCPWAPSHSIGREYDSSTVVFAASSTSPNGWFHCSHSHCVDRHQREVLDMLPIEARALLIVEEAPKVTATKLPKEAARLVLEGAFRAPGDGVSVVVAGCGVGKTEAAITVALERAETPHSPKSKGVRAPAHSRTALSVPTNKLAREVAGRARARGGQVLELFGPLSQKHADGSPVCGYHGAATAFAVGGLSIPWQFCQGQGREACDLAETCEARDGMRGPLDARIIVGPHALLSSLAEAAGTTGLLVVDEPPALLQHVVVTPAELAATAKALGHHFEDRYAVAMRPILESLERWIATGPIGEPAHLSLVRLSPDPELLERAFEATGEADLAAIARAAFEPVPEGKPARRSTAAPVRFVDTQVARRSLAIAKAIGKAARIARLVWLSMTCALDQGRVRLEERGGKRVLVVTLPDAQLLEELRTFEGSMVVADAGGRLHLPVYRAVVGYTPRLTEVHVEDGAKVDRLILKTRATRAGWFPHGRLDVSRALVRSVRLAVEWLLEGDALERAAVITFEALEVALLHAAGVDVSPRFIGKDELRAKLPDAVLEDARREFGPLLARLPRLPDVGHYGGVRGLDHWKGHGALVTLGDPWPQLSDGQWEASFLALPNWEQRLEAYAAGELEQAHGRLRTVHRTAPARALHVGRVVPVGWDRARVREDVGGSRVVRHTAEEIRAAVARAGSVRAASRVLGLDVKTVRRHVGVPP